MVRVGAAQIRNVAERQIAWALLHCVVNPGFEYADPIDAAGVFVFVAVLAIELAGRFFVPPPANKLAAVAY